MTVVIFGILFCLCWIIGVHAHWLFTTSCIVILLYACYTDKGGLEVIAEVLLMLSMVVFLFAGMCYSYSDVLHMIDFNWLFTGK